MALPFEKRRSWGASFASPRQVWPQFFASEQSATTFLDGFTHPSGMLPEPLPGIRLGTMRPFCFYFFSPPFWHVQGDAAAIAGDIGGRSNPFEKLKREAEVRDAKLLGRKVLQQHG